MIPSARFPSVGPTAAEHGLTLVRAHPRLDRLHLDLVDAHGRRVIGQWLVDATTAKDVAASTDDLAPGAVRLLGRHLVRQDGGADRRLRALAPLVAAGAELIVHRPERRAVVRTTPDGGGRAVCTAAGPRASAVYTKVVRPRRTAALVRRMGQAAMVPGLDVPQVVAVDEEAGTIRTSTLPGRTLHDLLPEGVPVAAEQVGVAVRTLHSAGGVDGVPRHDLRAEVENTRVLLGLARRHHALTARAIDALERDVSRAASVIADAGAVGSLRLLHRDLHDKQVLIDGEDVGMLDVDTLGMGDPALDLGNLLAHLDLRAHQGCTTVETASAVEDEVLFGYGPDARTSAAADGFRALSRARLRALYAFRPGDCRS